MSDTSFPEVDDATYVREVALGTGGFGATYRARDASGRRVVIKELHAEREADVGEQFRAEAQHLTRLDHPSIVRVYQLGRWRQSRRLFFAMDFVEGSTLEELVEPRELTNILDSLAPLVDVTRALVHAHGEQLVHRDVKPLNVIVAKRRGVVVDWGLAAKIGVSDDIPMRGAGTPGYMSPEQARGEAPHPSMDVYSVGCVLYALLGGAPPLADELRDVPLLNARAIVMYKAPADIAGRVDPRLARLAELAMRCLTRDANARPSMSELEALLGPWATLCPCTHCGCLSDRVTAARGKRGAICAGCAASAALDELVPHRRALAEPIAIANAVAEIPDALDAIERIAIVADRDGIRSTKCRDELGRAAIVEEISDDATQAQRDAFERRVEVLAALRAGVFPSVLRVARAAMLRQEVTGSSVAEALAESARDVPALLAATRTFIRGVDELHGRGWAHGALAKHTLVSAQSAIVVDDWRSLAQGDAGRSSDLANVLAIARGVVAGHRLGARFDAIAPTLTKLQQDRHALARLGDAIDRLFITTRCHGCNDELPIDETSITQSGYLCRTCESKLALEVSRKVGRRRRILRTVDASLVVVLGAALLVPSATIGTALLVGWVALTLTAHTVWRPAQ